MGRLEKNDRKIGKNRIYTRADSEVGGRKNNIIKIEYPGAFSKCFGFQWKCFVLGVGALMEGDVLKGDFTVAHARATSPDAAL